MRRVAALLLVLAALGFGAYLLWTQSGVQTESPVTARPDAAPRVPGAELTADRPELVSGVAPKPAHVEAPPPVDQKPRARTIVWPVKAGTAPVPADGIEVRLTPWTNSGVTNVPPVGRMEGSRLAVTGWRPGYAAAYAQAPDGSVARLQAQPGEDVGPETAFYALRTIEVIVTLEGDGPAVGWSVTALDQGNNPVVPAVKTDATGTARLTDLYGGPHSLVDVRVTPDGRDHWSRGFAAGAVDLARQDGRLEVTIPREREVVLAVRIDGAPGLPPPPTMLQVHGEQFKDVSRDEAMSELRVRWRAPPQFTATTASASISGFVPASTRLEIHPGTGPIRGTLELQRAGALLVHVDLPADKRHHVQMQAFDEAKGAWPEDPLPSNMSTMSIGQPTEADAEGNLRLNLLRPGRYRVYDSSSAIVSPEVRVVAGDTPAEVRLDLRTAGWVRGRVEVPLLHSLAGAAVSIADAPRRTDPGAFGSSGVTSVNEKDGTFWFRVPGNRDLRLRVSHPLLRADPREGTVEVREPRDGVVLKLVLGPTAMVRFDREVMTQMNRGSKRSLAVRLYDGEPTGEPRAALGATLEGDGLSASFGGFDPGTWTVWIDTPPFVPTVFRGVSLADGPNDLGTATLSEGSRFVMEVKVKEGQSPPRFALWLQAEDDPTYQRSADFAAAEGKVTGLARGRYRMTAHAYGGARTLPSEVIEFDGTTEVRRTLDLR